ncbi:ABC transporter ATP-binding protein [Microtetraspora glauca]|uniref:ABC transporter ATP-binding protein n=1 Tax=Microtetraspora glauca TaxID=1996 RepID=A0ABV3GPF1_MICGL
MAPEPKAGGAAAPSPAGPALLSVRDLAVTFRTRDGEVPAVREVSFDLARGEILGLVGESGSGKSTLLTALMRMLPRNAGITAGHIGFDGTDLLALREDGMRRLRGDRIGLIPQRPMTSLSPTTSVGRQLRWHLDGLDEGRLKELLGGVGLGAVLDRLDSYPFEFSGGQLQRLLIAVAALGKQPDLLLADEPTTTLDATVQAQVLRLLLELRDRVGLTMVFVTHDLGVISQVSDRIGVMYAGRLVEVAPARELFDAPRHPYTRALLEAIPGRHRRGEPLRSIPGTVTGANRLPGCPFAPRCAAVVDRCHEENPEVREVGESLVRCHRAGEDL